jgi:hypothetical protein
MEDPALAFLPKRKPAEESEDPALAFLPKRESAPPAPTAAPSGAGLAAVPAGRQPFPGLTARDRALRQEPEFEPSPPVKDERTGAVKAFLLGGANTAAVPYLMEEGGKPQGAEALTERIGITMGWIPENVREAENKLRETGARNLRADISKAEGDRPAEFLTGELATAAALPGPKGGPLARAAIGGAEGVMMSAPQGGNPLAGGAASAAASGLGGLLGKAVGKFAARGQQKAAAATAAVAAKEAAKHADDAAAAARAKVATAAAAPAAGETATNQVVRVMSPDGKGIQAIGSIEKMDGDIATVFAGGRRLEVPADRLQPIKTVTSSGTVASPPRDADKLTAAAEREAKKLEAAAKKANAAAKKADVAAHRAGGGGNRGFEKLTKAAVVGGGTIGGGIYVAKDAIQDPDKAAKRLGEAGAVGAAAFLAAKGKKGAGRLAEIAATKGAEALDTAAGRVTRALAGQASASGRRVGAGTLARIVMAARSGQPTAQLEQQAAAEGATPEEVQTAVRAGSR